MVQKKRPERWSVGRKVEWWLSERKNARPRLRPYNVAQLAERVGVTKTAAGFWVNPKKESVPEKENLRALSEVMGVSLEWLTNEALGPDDISTKDALTAALEQLPRVERDLLSAVLNDEHTKQVLLATAAALAESGARSPAGRR